jgi:hypothetical protein
VLLVRGSSRDPRAELRLLRGGKSLSGLHRRHGIKLIRQPQQCLALVRMARDNRVKAGLGRLQRTLTLIETEP